MAPNYFKNNNTNKWSLKAAFQEIEENKPSLSVRNILHFLKAQLIEIAEGDDNEKKLAAKKHLENWDDIRSMFITKSEKEQSTRKVIINNNGIFINKPKVNTIYNESSQAASSLKRKEKEVEVSSEEGSWNSADHNRKKKYQKIYISSMYANTDFGGIDDDNISWIVNNMNMTKLLRNYRNKSIEGAQMRKTLSNSRILSLSYIFLLSKTYPCVLSKMKPADVTTVIRSLNIKKTYKAVEENVVSRCYKINKMLQEDDFDDDDYRDKLDNMKVECTSQEEKVAVNIITSLFDTYMNNKIKKEAESNLIIETLRPFIMNCIAYKLKGLKFEWITYRMISKNGQIMIPDFAIFTDPLSDFNFELFVVEVKKPGNFSNGHLETDLVKLGKEMQLALDKLVKMKVENPEVVGLLVEGYKATTYKMDLKYNGQYRLIEMSSFFVVRNSVDDNMLVPSIMEKMYQLQVIIEGTLDRLYEAIQGQDGSEDHSSYQRDACGSPVTVKK